ncbi:hypothetical protein [Pseudomonas silensiensis]|uniref:hypothetical protein n=1 Tax=Pseudomonas silensiensis TaxID=2991049 RepID=UPI003D1BD719
MVSRQEVLIRGPSGQDLKDAEVKLHFYRYGRFVKEDLLTNISLPFTHRAIDNLDSGEYEVHYQYFNTSSNRWSDWYASAKFYVSDPVTVSSPTPEQALWGPFGTVSGTATIGGHVQILRADNLQPLSGVGTLQRNSNWLLGLNESLVSDTYTAIVKHWITNYTALYSDSFTFHLRPPPSITTPVKDEVIWVSKPVVSGRGEPGATVVIHKFDDAIPYGAVEVRSDSSWSTTLTRPLPQGANSLHAWQTKDGGLSRWSTAVPVIVPGVPSITGPGAGTEQEPAFTLIGNSGLGNNGLGNTGVQIEVFTDLTDTSWGRHSLQDNGNWSVALSGLPPGPLSLVAERIHGSGERSGRSQARGFKIRPPQLAAIKTEFLTTPVASVKFSGVGHTGATVEITVVSGPGGTAPPAVQVRNGQWETTAANWTFGTYKLSAVQKVPDNANGWIPSQPNTFDVVRAVPPPTNVKYTVDDRTPIFTGNGENGATVIITDTAGGSVDVPDASVNAGTWLTRARAPWAPVNSRSIKVVQKIETATSAFVEIKVTIENLAPPSEVAYSVTDYTPTFTGKGIVGATIHVLDAGNNDVTRPVLLTRPGWSIAASATWGPTKSRKVFVVHKKDGLTSTPVELNVAIGLLAPEITRVTVDELHAEVAGTCWAGAVVTLKFNDSADVHKPDVSNGTWVFKRPTPFTPTEEYTVTATQTFADLEPSPPASRQFAVKLPTPQITGPDDKADVWRDFTVKGDKGYNGATMQLRDAQFDRALGEPKVLTEDGEWSMDLTGLEFRRYTIDAQQKLNQGASERSEPRVFEVVLAPPVISVPMENGDLPRTSTLSGWAMPGGRVEVWLKDAAVPLLTDIAVGNDGFWQAEVTKLPVGAKTIWARQTFDRWTSKDSQPLNYNVVPAAPFIETPATDEHIGRRVVVSGFGVPGDSVTVKLADATHSVLGLSPVLEDRTWSVTVAFDQPGGLYALVAVASCDGFDSGDSIARAVVLGTYQPPVDAPAQGQRVSHPVGFKGRGRPGVGQVVSWFSPDQVWAPDLPVTGGAWQGEAQQSLPLGGQWCRFRQSITDVADGATVSDWVESKRFESVPPVAEP